MTRRPRWDWRRLLINRDYALFMAGSFVSALGSWFQGVAIGWMILELSGSPFYLGLSNFALMAPLFFLGLGGGVLADRFDRRLLLIAGMSVSATALGVLALLALTGRASVGAILLASLVVGLSQVIVWPSWNPFIKDLVPASRLAQAIAFNSARFNLTRVIGPALAGLVVARAGAGACIAVASIAAWGVIVTTWFIRPRRRRRRHPVLAWRAALGEGISYVRADSFTLRVLALTGAFGLLVLPYHAFMPALARDVLVIGAEGLGILLTAAGAGAVAGALLSGTPAIVGRPRLALASFALVSGAGLALLATASPAGGPAAVATSVAALACIGLGSTGYLTTANTVLQLRVPDALVGRVMGLWVVMNAGTTPIGSLAIGGIAESFGVPPAILSCGAIGLAIGALVPRAVAHAGPLPAPYARVDMDDTG